MNTGKLVSRPMTTSHKEPLSLKDVDAEWLTDVLSEQYPGVEVSTLTVDAPIEGMAVKCRLNISYKGESPGGLPSSMIVKGRFERHSAEWDWVYESEMLAYRDFLPTLAGAPAPQVYFAGYEPLKSAPIVLLEDLTLKRVTFNDIHSPLTYHQALRFLDVLAKCHSRYWDSAELKVGGNFEWTVPLISGFLVDYFLRVTSSPKWQQYLSLSRGTTVPRSLRDGERMRRGIYNLAELQKSTPWCIIHGDCHFGNSYLCPDGSPGFIDWQLKRGPWHQDFTYFLVSALDIVDRRNWEMSLLQYYLSRLAACGVSPPSFSDALLTYRAEIIYGLVVWITNGDENNEFQKEPINTGNTARFVAAALDHDSLSILT
jgi:hypothetical protein